MNPGVNFQNVEELKYNGFSTATARRKVEASLKTET